MTLMPTLIITARSPCTVCFGGGASFLGRGESVLIPCAPDSENFFTVWGVSGYETLDKLAVPVLHRVTLTGGRITGSSAPALDWGEAAELTVGPEFVPAIVHGSPMLMAQTDFLFRERRSKVELISDGGAKLVFFPDGMDPLSLSLGDGEEGELRTVDVGSARLLAVKLAADMEERLVIVTHEGETILDVSGSKASIEDGAPTVTEYLGTVRGHEKRTRYEYERGGFRKTEESIGFFERPAREPASCAETALALAEELRLGVYRPEYYRFAGALAGGVEEGSLREFFGAYSDESRCPFALPEGKAQVGLISETGIIRRPRKFLFAFDGGAITDIDEI